MESDWQKLNIRSNHVKLLIFISFWVTKWHFLVGESKIASKLAFGGWAATVGHRGPPWPALHGRALHWFSLTAAFWMLHLFQLLLLISSEGLSAARSCAVATQPLDLKRAFVDEKPVAELSKSCGCQMLLWLVLSRQEQTLDLSGVLLPFAVQMSLDIHFYLKSGEFITDDAGEFHGSHASTVKAGEVWPSSYLVMDSDSGPVSWGRRQPVRVLR